MENVIYLVLAASVLALGFAFYFYKRMLKEDEGTDLMKKIALYVRKGAMAYLKQQYKVVIIVFVILAAIFGVMSIFGLQNGWVWFAFLTGGFFSGLAGFFGMKTATYASARTANAARKSLNDGLQVAFRSGAVMGLTVVGLALLDISLWFLVLDHFIPAENHLVIITTTMLTFGMGASTQALFARVGGGIYTKAADVGADLVGKTEYNIPEDDPRNPATIADNVGDNVGDVAGMGSDLFESYVGSFVSAVTLAVCLPEIDPVNGCLFPLILGGIGILASIFAIFLVRGKEGSNPSTALNMGTYISAAVVIVVSIFL
ncbi:MAG: sodium/proton-translocating pyrophosphatase, partial [Bacteroidia bacterium]|nr:sodium/proton-translocating pyrophosphatase [Bacteroidia bacterium]